MLVVVVAISVDSEKWWLFDVEKLFLVAEERQFSVEEGDLTMKSFSFCVCQEGFQVPFRETLQVVHRLPSSSASHVAVLCRSHEEDWQISFL